MLGSKKATKKSIIEYIFIGIICLTMVVLLFNFCSKEYSYYQYETSSTHYLRAEVTEIVTQELLVSGSNGEYTTGNQTVRVKMLSGDIKGESIEIENYITLQHNVILKNGSRVIVSVDAPENVEPYYTIYNYDRSKGILLLSVCFILLVIIIGRKRGVMSCIGLTFTVSMVICFLVPSLYSGSNAISALMFTVTISTTVTCFCISGFSRKTLLNIISSTLGGITAGIIYWIFTVILNVSGSSIDEAESLVLISNSTGLKLNGVLFAGIIVCSLGAVMDVAVSLGASLGEIKTLRPEITSKELFSSGINIGRDMIGTMTNTLILAFLGSEMATLITFISYGVEFNQLLSSNFIALEVAKGLSGSLAVVLSVPISAMVCSVGYKNYKGEFI